MKKILSLILSIAVAFSMFSLSACGGGGATSSRGAQIGIVTDVGELMDKGFNQGTYEGVKAYAEAHGKTYKYYQPANGNNASDNDRIAAMRQAINNGAEIICINGFLQASAIETVASEYPDVKIIFVDGWVMDNHPNVTAITYKEHESSYLAGYAAVKEGYKHLGFLGGMSVPAVIRYGYGFVQGAEKAASEMGIAKDVTIEYVYGGQFYGDQTITAAMDTWYQQRGVEVVFACGGGIWTSACEAAAKTNGKVIGVDVDQTELINAYGDGMCVTSAMKGLGATVKAVLKSVMDGSWSQYSGKISSLGLVSATDLDANFVQLPTDTWVMKNFSVDDYKALVADVFNGKVAVSSSTDAEPAHTITLNMYKNIK